MEEKTLFSFDSAVLATAGALGSVCAQLLTMPLTTSFTRAQLEQDFKGKGPIHTVLRIIKKEGIEGLYRGCISTCESVAVSNFVYFYTFHGLKNSLARGQPQTPLQDLVFACIAGCCNVLLTNPIWVVNSRLRMSGVNKSGPRYKGLLDGLVQIGRQEGWTALWNGAKASLILVSNPAIKFTLYELMKRKFVKFNGGRPLTGNSAFLLGALATSVATVITYPVQVLQAKARNSSKKIPLTEIYQHIIREDGVLGLYKGLDSKLLQSMLATGFMFLAYEKIAALVFTILGAHNLKLKH